MILSNIDKEMFDLDKGTFFYLNKIKHNISVNII